LHLKRLVVSLILLACFFTFVGAKAKSNKRSKASLYDKIKQEYLIYKNSKNQLKDSVLKGYILKFDKLENSKKPDEIVGSKYFKADIYEKLYEITGKDEYLQEAISLYKEVSQYKNSNFYLAARKKLDLLEPPKNNNEIPHLTTDEKKEQSVTVVDSVLKNIKYWSDTSYTRVVLEFDRQAIFEHRSLKEDPDNKKPPRIFIDIKGRSYDEKFRTPLIIKDNLLEQIRVGQFKEDIVRVVLDLSSITKYTVFSLTNPFRVVIDIYGSEKPHLTRPSPAEDKKIQERKVETRNIFHNIRSVVIDTGHGGHDPGAIGVEGLKEKDVVLDIGFRVGRIIKENFPEINVIYTKEADVYLTLEERVAIANAKKADLFISIHANASKNKSASGIETYFLDFAKEKSAMEVVARENATSIEGVEEVQTILKDLLISSKYNDSSLFASIVQRNLVARLKAEYDDINDLGVKQGPFFVLLGSAMPSILVEVSFITHPVEGRRLASSSYREKIAEGIFEGIREYILKAALVQHNEDKHIR